MKLTESELREVFKSMTYEEINKLRDSVIIKVGDVLITDNGDFMIVKVEINQPRLYCYGAMYLGDEIERHEVQYTNEDFDELIKKINEGGKITNVKKGKISY